MDESLVAGDGPIAGDEDLEKAVTAAQEAFPAWKKLAPTSRRNILLNFADLIDENAEAFARLTRITLGSPIASSTREIAMCAELFRYYAGWIDKFASSSFPQNDGFLMRVRNEPMGVVAGITAWHAPIGMVGFKAAPAVSWELLHPQAIRENSILITHTRAFDQRGGVSGWCLPGPKR